MAEALRKTGISVVGDLPWGTHFCYFYETKQDLLDSLVPYFKAGLESKEYCLWLISEPLTTEEAGNALRQAVPDLDGRLAEQSIEILPHKKWFLERGVFDLETVIGALGQKLDQALARGYPGMRFSGNPAWLGEKDEKVLLEYEKALDQLVAGQPIVMSCTFQLATTQATAIFEVVRTHQVVGAMRQGNWEVVETPELKETKAGLAALTETLEERVAERTRELEATNEDLRKEIVERGRCEVELRQAQERTDSILAGVADTHIIVDRQWRYVYTNKAAVEAIGLPSEQILGRTLWEVFPDIIGTELEGQYRRAMDEGVSACFEFYYPATDTWWKNRFYPRPEGLAIFATNITDQRKAQEALKKREKELEAKSADLEETNTALKVLLKHREEDKTTLENAILSNVRELVLPYAEKLRNTHLDGGQRTFLSIIESNLEDVISPFLQKMGAGYAHFTPMELRVAHLIRSGKTSKEIASLLGLSKRTVDTHRDSIRKKLNLGNKKANLQSYLISFSNT